MVAYLSITSLHASSLDVCLNSLLQTRSFESQFLLPPIFNYPQFKGFCSHACLGNLALLVDTAQNWGCTGATCRKPLDVAVEIAADLKNKNEDRDISAMLPEEIHQRAIQIVDGVAGAEVKSVDLPFKPRKPLPRDYLLKERLGPDDIIGEPNDRAQVVIGQMALLDKQGRLIASHSILIFPEPAPSTRVTLLDPRMPNRKHFANVGKTSGQYVGLDVEDPYYRSYYSGVARNLVGIRGSSDLALGNIVLRGATRIRTPLSPDN